jgi:hypothetical protein
MGREAVYICKQPAMITVHRGEVQRDAENPTTPQQTYTPGS